MLWCFWHQQSILSFYTNMLNFRLKNIYNSCMFSPVIWKSLYIFFSLQCYKYCSTANNIYSLVSQQTWVFHEEFSLCPTSLIYVMHLVDLCYAYTIVIASIIANNKWKYSEGLSIMWLRRLKQQDGCESSDTIVSWPECKQWVLTWQSRRPKQRTNMINPLLIACQRYPVE